MFSGFAAIGSTVFGLAAGSTAAIAAGIATSAVVGAAIGGLTAAISGGDIGKGILFGAIGGIVTGGVMGGSLATSGAGGAIDVTAAEAAKQMGVNSGTQLALAEGTYGVTAGEALVGGGSMFGQESIKKLGTDIGTNSIGSKLVDFAVAGMAPEQELPYGQTKEGFLAQLAANSKDTATMAGSKVKPQHSWGITEEGIRYAGDEAFKLAELSGDQQQANITTEYQMAEDAEKSKWNREQGKYVKAAEGRSQAGFQGGSDQLKAQIIASQSGALRGANG